MNGPATTQRYEWGLHRKSLKRTWVGLTTREMQLMVYMLASQNPSDWILWHASWPEWQELSASIKVTQYEMLKPNMRAVHADLPSVQQESKKS